MQWRLAGPGRGLEPSSELRECNFPFHTNVLFVVAALKLSDRPVHGGFDFGRNFMVGNFSTLNLSRQMHVQTRSWPVYTCINLKHQMCMMQIPNPLFVKNKGIWAAAGRFSNMNIHI